MKVLFEKEKNQSGRYLLALVFASTSLSLFVITTHNAFADQVVATIPIAGQGLGIIGVNPQTNMIYVEDFSTKYFHGSTVHVIDGSTNSVVHTIQVLSTPFYLAVNPNTNLIYVTSEPGYRLTVINGSTNTIVNTIHLNFPMGVAINPTTNKIYVMSDGLTVIDGSTNNSVVTSVPATCTAFVAVNPNTNQVYLANYFGNSVCVINGTTNTLVGSIGVGTDLLGIGVDAITNKIYVTNDTAVTVIDGSTNRVVDTIPIGNSNSDTTDNIAVNPTTNKIYVVNNSNNTVTVIDGSTDTVSGTISVQAPNTIAANPDTNMIYVSNSGVNTISVIDGNSDTITTSQLQVNSQDSFGNALTGFYTELYASNGTQIDAGYTPLNFTLNNADTYTVHVENFGKFIFSHWLDTGSTDANRTISITSNESITAVYKTVPQPPTKLAATAVSSSQMNLTWNAPTNNGGSPVTSYEIKRSTDGSTWKVLVKNTHSTSTTYSDTGLAPNTTYYYRVFAINDVGTSLRSNTASATTPLLSVAGVKVGPTSTTLP